MNAYELADELDNMQTIASMTTLRKIANMLRQQAKEKELLQNQSSELAKEVMYFQEQNRQQADRIAYLEKCIEDCYTIQTKQADKIAELEKELLYTKYMQGVNFK